MFLSEVGAVENELRENIIKQYIFASSDHTLVTYAYMYKKRFIIALSGKIYVYIISITYILYYYHYLYKWYSMHF